MAKSTSKLFESEEPKEMSENALNLPETQETDKSASISTFVNTNTELEKEAQEEAPDSVENIVDVDLSAIRRKRFRINGDSKKILELNVSDLNTMSRLTAAYERLNKYMDKVSEIFAGVPDNADDLTEEQQKQVEKALEEIDNNMRKELDYIFDAPVSEVCGDGGSMYDPFDGQFRYEHIIDALSKLYETNLNSEFAKMRRRVSAKTSKYTKKYHR